MKQNGKNTAERQKFIFSRQMMEIIDACPEDDRAMLALALVSYGMRKQKVPLSGVAAMMFSLARIELDRKWRNYANSISKTDSHKRGGAPKGNRNAMKNIGETPAVESVAKNVSTVKNNTENNTENRRSTPIKQNNINKNISIERADFIDARFKDCFARWLDYKRERKELYKVPSSLKAAYNRLVRLSGGRPERAMQIVDQSIAASWKGLYELADNKPSPHGGSPATAMQTGVVLRDNSTTKYDNQKIW